jgi:membrane protease YdiL (CAAX protease family)
MVPAELVQPLIVAQPQPRWSQALIAAAAMLFAITVGLTVGGDIGRFSAAGLAYLPAFLLVGLLQLRQFKAARVLSWIWFWFMVLGVALLALGLTAGAAMGLQPSPNDLERLVAPSLAMVAILIVGVLLAVTPAWAGLGRVLGATLDRSHPSHAQGTVGLLVGSALALAPLALLGGHAPLVTLLSRIDPSSLNISMAAQLIDQISSVIWTIALVLWASAWPTRLAVRAAMARLGLTSVRWKAVLPLAALTVVAVGLGMSLDYITHQVIVALGWPLTDASIITRLMPVATTPVGALVIALCAGLSEELLFRGLLQPRFGWLLANTGFVAMHAFQYGLDGLLVVFAIGALLAFVRHRWNTTASIGVHAGYDLILLTLAMLGF